MRTTRAAGALLVAVGLLVSCLRDASGPGRTRRAHLTLAPVFESRSAGLVDFDRVRVTVVRALAARLVVDTVIAFPPTADSVELAVVVPLQTVSEEFLVFVRLVTAAGDTVFRNEPYPQAVVAVAGGASAVLETLLRYVGLGASAAGVIIATPDTVVTFGQPLDLAAAAYGTDQQPIPGTPIVWSSLDTLQAYVPDRETGRIVGANQRGPARVVAELLTGPADTVLVTAQPPPSQVAMVSGDGQQGTPAKALPLPLRVQVTAPDGLGVQVPVSFRALAPGASVRDAVVPSDAAGFSETVVTLGPAKGAQSFEAAVVGLAPVSFTAIAFTPIAQVIVTPTTATTGVLGSSVQFVAEARDDTGKVLPATFSWTSSDPAVASVDPATGLATARGNGVATITATADGVPGSGVYTVVQVAAQLLFSTPPTNTTAGVTFNPAAQVSAVDSGGSVALNFARDVTISRGDSLACPAILLGTTTVTAVQGVATFTDLTIEVACADLQLQATDGTLSTPLSAPFTVFPGSAAVVTLVSGDGQFGTVATALVNPLVVRVADQYDNAVAGHAVSWVVTGGGGVLAPGAPTTDAAGQASATWTLGTLAGLQRAEARAGQLTGSPVPFGATANPGPAAQLVFLVQPSEAVVLRVIAPPVEVGAADQYGNKVPWTMSVTVDIGNNPPPGTGVLGGTKLKTPVNNVATFDDLTIDVPADGYTLKATSSTLSAESKPFNITLLPGGVVFGGDSVGLVLSSSGVFRVQPDGTGRLRLDDRGSKGDVHPRWSPNRQRVTFSFDSQRAGRNELFLVSDNGIDRARLVSDMSTRRARWSPDGVHLGFECGDAFDDVCVMPDVTALIGDLVDGGDGSGKTVVTDFDPDKPNGPGAFAWDPLAPDFLVVVRDGLTDKAEPVSGLYRVSFDRKQVDTLSGQLIDPNSRLPLTIVGTLDWSRDGSTIVFAAAQRLYVIDAKPGAVPRQLTQGPGIDSRPVFSPDGRQVLFLRYDQTKCSLDYWRADVADGVETQVSAEGWCDLGDGVLGHDWSPDGKDVVLVGGQVPGEQTNLLIYRVSAGTTAATYKNDRALIGRGVDVDAVVKDIQPSWRP